MLPPATGEASAELRIGMMYGLRVFAVALMETDALTDAGLTAGPSFEYVDVAGGMPA